MKLLILGANGLLGNTIIRYFFKKKEYQTYGLIKNSSFIKSFDTKFKNQFFIVKNILNYKLLDNKIKNIRPDLIINCIGITNKYINNQIDYAERYININSLFPHKLYQICSNRKVRLIHLSSDCVFSGDKGFYSEEDHPDPKDIYGRSKLLGELDFENCITLRKSVIGHELITKNGLLEWFLGGKNQVQGYKNAFFSGLTVLELAKIIDLYIIPREKLQGIFHVAGNTISKYDLLKIISSEYQKHINIIPNESIRIDRSLNSNFFNNMTGYQSKSWQSLVRSMCEFDSLN